MALKNNGDIDWLNEKSRQNRIQVGYNERFCIDDIVDNSDNFFNMDTNQGGLKDSIRTDGVRNPVQLEMKVTDGKVTYVLVEGHRRVLSCRQLVEEGHEEFRHVKANVNVETNPVKELEQLITSNTTQRQLTTWEMCMAASMLREAYEKDGVQGVRDMVAEKLHLSTGQTSKYFYIGEHLIDGLMGVFKAGVVTMNLIHDAAHLTESEQAQLADIAAEKGTFAKEDIDGIVSGRVIPGQQSLVDNNIPDGDNENGCFDNVPDNDVPVGSEDVEKLDWNLSPSDKSDEEAAAEENLSPSDKSDEEAAAEENLSPSDKSEAIEPESSESTIQADEDITEITDKETEAAAVEDTKPKTADRYDTLSVVRKLIAHYDELVHRYTRSDKDFENKCILDALVLYEAQIGKIY